MTGRCRLKPLGVHGDKILVPHGHDRQLQPDAAGDVVRMGAGRIDHHFAFDRAAIGFDAGDATILAR